MSVITLEQVEKAQVILDFLKANPHLHDQHTWLRSSDNTGRNRRDQVTENHNSPERPLVLSDALSCGTAGCFAGWLSMLEGQPVYFDSGLASAPYVITEYGEESLAEWAEDMLGLRGVQEFDAGIPRMFDETNTIDDLSAWVDAMRESYRSGRDLVAVAVESGLLNEENMLD